MDWGGSNDIDIERCGYTLLPELVPADLIDRAKALIESDFVRTSLRSDEEWDQCSRDTFCKALIDENGLDFLVTESGALAFANQGVGNLSGYMQVQVARRRYGESGYPHIDGFFSETGDADVDTPDAILGIYLTDVLEDQDGAFTVWPDARSQVTAWVTGLDSTPRMSVGQPDFEDLETGIPVLGEKGTAFLIQGAVPHCNLKRTIKTGYRDAVFFRFYRDDPYRNVLALLRGGGTCW